MGDVNIYAIPCAALAPNWDHHLMIVVVGWELVLRSFWVDVCIEW